MANPPNTFFNQKETVLYIVLDVKSAKTAIWKENFLVRKIIFDISFKNRIL